MTVPARRLPGLAARWPQARERERAQAPSTARGKLLPSLFSVLLLAIVASPVIQNWRAEQTDDFPLSYYRMFSEDRADRQRVNYLVGLDVSGNRYLLRYSYVGPGGMNQVRRQMNKQVDMGEATRLCETAAARVARAGSRLRDIRRIEVITGTFQMSEYFSGQTAPNQENVRARCTVQRT